MKVRHGLPEKQNIFTFVQHSGYQIQVVKGTGGVGVDLLFNRAESVL